MDDEARNRRLLEAMLTPEGYHLQTAASGSEALSLAHATVPDLILSDVNMAGLGYDFITLVKADLHLQAISFVFITST